MRVLQASTWASRRLGSTGGGSFTAGSTLFNPFSLDILQSIHKRVSTGDSLAWSHGSGNSPSTPTLCKLSTPMQTHAVRHASIICLSIHPLQQAFKCPITHAWYKNSTAKQNAPLCMLMLESSHPSPFPLSLSTTPKPHPPRSPFPLPTSPPRYSSTPPSSRKGIAASLYIDSQNQPLVSNAYIHTCSLDKVG